MKKQKFLNGEKFVVNGDKYNSYLLYQHDSGSYIESLKHGISEYYSSIDSITDDYFITYCTFFGEIVKTKIYFKDIEFTNTNNNGKNN